jgi:hypothetical protein
MPVTPQQRAWQGRFEGLIGLAAPALDMLLNVGDRASRVLLGDDTDYYPIRPAAEAFELDAAREEARNRKRQAPVD